MNKEQINNNNNQLNTNIIQIRIENNYLNEENKNIQSNRQIIDYENKETPIYFCCNSQNRIFLKCYGVESCGFFCAFLSFIIPIGSLNILAFPKVNNKIWKILNFIIGDLIMLITAFSFFNVVTSSPGYEDLKNKISRIEYEELNPTVKIKNSTFKLKYCETCQIVRHLRSFHCKYCNKCILRQDHHCVYVNNCIGKFNHLKFLLFLISVDFYCLYCCIFCIVLPIKEKKKNLGLGRIVYLVIIALFAISMFLTMVPFTFSHIYLISVNKTTREEIKSELYDNVLNNGCCENWKEVC